MMRARNRAIALVCLAGALSACIGTTGYELVDFHADAAGPADARAGQPLEFVTDRGWHVVLTTAKLHIGAVYLDQSRPVSGSGNTPCIFPGTYVGQVTSAVDVDLLSPSPTPFAGTGEGTTLPAAVAQVWLTHGDVNTTADVQPILALEGTADKAGDVRPFTAGITIGANRVPGSTASAGSNPICKQRIVAPVTANVILAQGGTLHLTIDPRQLFVNVDFSSLAAASTGTGYAFKDDSSDQPSTALYSALRSTGSLYTFSWSAN
ncbi:MAG: hypothetical protein ACRELY_18665 [Polyangiaceae bacterium]